MQKIPTLNSNATGFQVKPTGTVKENDCLLEETVKCLELLPDICSDTGNNCFFKFFFMTLQPPKCNTIMLLPVFIRFIAAVDVQPTLLYLSTCILGEAVASEAACAAVLQFYHKIATHRLNCDTKWQKFILCTIAKLLDMAKTGMIQISK